MATDSHFEEFNRFQTSFYTNIKTFNEFTLFDFRRHGFTLLYNLSKGFPNLSNIFLNLKGIGWTGTESPSVLKALQRNFVNNFNATKIPNFIYYKSEKSDKTEKIKKTNQGFLFDQEIQNEIKSLLLIDSKTYDYLKFTEKIQFLGQQLNGEFVQKNKIKPVKKK